MKPEVQMREVRPSEMRAWKYKFDQWFRSSFQGSVPLSLEVDTFMCFLDSWWLNRIQPKVRKETCIEDLWRSVAEEMKVLWPISRRREMLFECKHKQGRPPVTSTSSSRHSLRTARSPNWAQNPSSATS